jgi:phosphatidylglycerophosphate synthase
MSREISMAQLRAVTQPDSVCGRANAEHWVADFYLRKISPYLTRVLIRMNFSQNAVTWLMILTGLATAFSLLIPGLIGVTLALVLGQLQMLWDCCDGEVARWRKQSSPARIFLDKLGHYMTESAIAVALGLRLGDWPQQSLGQNSLPTIGTIFAVIILLNKSLNDGVHVSRYFTGLPRLEDGKSASDSRTPLVNQTKKIFKIVPIHRMFHSVEMTIWILLMSIVNEISNVNLLVSIFSWIIPISLFVFIGHLISILTSNKLQSKEKGYE